MAALAVASAVAATVGANPAHAASCSAGYVGLTFDDGPSNDHTPALLNALKQNGLRATLFNEGSTPRRTRRRFRPRSPMITRTSPL